MIPIKGKTHDLGDGFMVARMLPQAGRRSIGPFLFFRLKRMFGIRV